MVGRRSVVTFAVSVLCLSSCGAGAGAPSEPVLRDDAVTIASFDFPESVLIGDLYAGAIRRAGVPVRVIPSAGPREVLEPALDRGLIEFLPEYAGTAVQFLSTGEVRSSSSAATTHQQLETELRGTPISALPQAPAQDANAIVVTAATAQRYDLTTVSDLSRVASGLIFGGPPECPYRPLCLPGYERTYGMSFKAFVPLDVGGPLTLQALISEEIDVGILFTSDPAIAEHHLVELRDDRGLQPAENVTPLIRTETLSRFGEPLSHAVDSVSARLTTSVLVSLNQRLLDGASPSRVASEWLTSEGLA